MGAAMMNLVKETETMAKTVSAEYLEGIRDGRAWLREHGPDDAAALLDNLNRTCRMFDAQSPVGQMLRGERDFWRNQIKLAR